MPNIEGYIHFFDIKSDLPGKTQSWSPNTLKVRLALNYKQLPYKESFISYPDIKPFCDEYNIEYDKRSFDTGPRACLPAIIHYDANGKIINALSDSKVIVRYLDSISPERPVLVSELNVKLGWNRLVDSYVSAFDVSFRQIWINGAVIIMPTIPPVLDERGAQYFIEDRSTWEDYGSKSPLEWGSKDPEEDWGKIIPHLKALCGVINVTKSEPFLLGTKPCYADFMLAGWLGWMRRGSEDNFQRVIKETGGEEGKFALVWNANVEFLEAQGEVKEWAVKSV